MIRFLSLLSVAIVLSLSATAQTEAKPVEQTQIFKYVEQMPEFKGDLMAFLNKNIVYPATSQKKSEQGRVYVQFVVNKAGYIQNTEILRSSGYPALDAEAVRVVGLMNGTPADAAMWKPGKNNGVAVDTYYTLPVSFSLNK